MKKLEIDLRIRKYENMGEKTGWSYVEISPVNAALLNPGVKTSFRVKGYIDTLPIKQLSLLPIGEGRFILPINSSLRTHIKKKENDFIRLCIELDSDEYPLDTDFVECLELDEHAYMFFTTLSMGHKRYFSNWVASAKTVDTKTDRINKCIVGLKMKMDYGEMIRYFKKKKGLDF
jgi:Domain of unknown function (DUF1905)/Bacteriocin-protection, YdeI or OmpD-Associated